MDNNDFTCDTCGERALFKVIPIAYVPDDGTLPAEDLEYTYYCAPCAIAHEHIQVTLTRGVYNVNEIRSVETLAGAFTVGEVVLVTSWAKRPCTIERMQRAKSGVVSVRVHPKYEVPGAYLVVGATDLRKVPS